MNGLLVKYKLMYNNTHHTTESSAVDIPPIVNKASLRVLGGTIYVFFLRAVTIKEGPAVSIGPVVIPEFGK